MNKKSVTTFFFRRHASPAVEKDIWTVKSLLRLDPRRDEFRVTGQPRHTPEEIAVDSRSMQEILVELAAGVQVPPEDVTERGATRVPSLSENPETSALIRIHSGVERPVYTYSAVFYRDRWFWIDDSDLLSNRVFMFLMIFYALSESRAVPQTSIVTISASGR